MSLLTDPLPTHIRGVPINSDFRTMILYERLLFKPGLPSDDKIRYALDLFFPEAKPGGRDAAWVGLQWFHHCGKPEIRARGGNCGENQVRAYDYDEDAPLIAAAFQQAYGIDLTAAHLHWWRFRALFDGLPADCRICKIMEYRTMDTRELPPTKRRHYERLKARYALERRHREPVTLEQHEQDFITRLRRGS